MTKVLWSDLILRDSDGECVTDTRKIEGLTEFRLTKSICGSFFDRLNLPHEQEDDASTWGPSSPNNVDWTGFPLSLDWKNEENPSWDGTGTVAESWYAVHATSDEQYSCRIDRFADEEGGGYAYSVERNLLDKHGEVIAGDFLPGGENKSAGSREEAEAKVIALLNR